MEYTSRVHKQSKVLPGVEFTVARLSLARRIDLGQRIREIGISYDFLSASKNVVDSAQKSPSYGEKNYGSFRGRRNFWGRILHL